MPSDRREHSFDFNGSTYAFITDNGVFSKRGIDEGTEILLKTLIKEDLHGNILDMGCGYGAIGIVLKSFFPDASLVMADINPRAVELAGINAEKNGTDVQTVVSDGFAAIRGTFDAVVSNPPIRTGKKVIYKMFEDAESHLKNGGALYVVIRRQQGAESALDELKSIYDNCSILGRKKGYWVLESKKLTD